MKFLVAIILSISLLTAESFATVSLHPPMVYAEKEDRSMAATEEVVKSTDGMIYLARFFSVQLFLSGIVVSAFATAILGTDDESGYDKSGARIGLAAGIGLTVLGGFCIYWSF